MKSMALRCSLMAIFSLAVFVSAISLNQTNWVSVSDTPARCSFSFPDSYTLNTQDDVRFYVVSADSVTFEVHVASTASTGNNAPSNQATIGPYTQFVQTLAQVRQGQIVSQSDVVVNGYSGRDAEVLFDNGLDDRQSRMHIRLFWHNGLMYVFSVASTVNNDAALASARTVFFRSIQLQ